MNLKNLLAALSILTLTASSAAFSAEKRTDGPPGSEYADFSKIEGQLQLGAQFGALLPSSTSKDSSFALGVDADFRPYELFGGRLTYLQGVSTPRASVITVTPLIHTVISNFEPYAMAGAGIGIVNFNKTKVKFNLAMGLGGDVLLTPHFGFGLCYMYHALVDSPDLHSLTARFNYTF